MRKEQSACKFISCFSYKGGAGRSTLAINVVPYLAEMLNATEERPFVLVDMDIDSCGLTFLFDLHNDPRIKKECVQSWFHPRFSNMPIVDEDEEEIESATEHEMFQSLYPVGEYFGFRPKEILCLPANPGEAIRGDSNYDAPLSSHISAFKRMCKNIACGVLFDSAVGSQLTAIWSNNCASHIMCCLRPTEQFREGTKHFFDIYDTKANSKNIIIIPNIVPVEKLSIRDKNGKLNSYPSYAKEKILEDFRDNLCRKNNNYILDLLDGEKFGVPKVDRFMWQEGVLKNADNLTDIEHTALGVYKEIARKIVYED